MFSSDSIFVLMLLAGLAGGLGHCVGMCGPLVILLSPRDTGLPHALRLHAGRVLSYALFGAVFAFVTAWLSLEIDVVPARRMAMWLAGAVLLLSGLSTLGLPLLRGRGVGLGGASIRRAAALARKVGPFTLGLFWGLLPCGLLYSAYAAAAGAGASAVHPFGGALKGALVLVLFGLGTAPPLVGIGWAAEQLPIGARTWLQRIAGAVVAVSGLLLILHAA
ncbi:MAG: sulfite exporter TauE/SafE family protein [Acidobacteriota bacterium]